MNVPLSQKEKMFLTEQKAHEESCVDKYAKYANQAQDPQLKQLLSRETNPPSTPRQMGVEGGFILIIIRHYLRSVQ